MYNREVLDPSGIARVLGIPLPLQQPHRLPTAAPTAEHSLVSLSLDPTHYIRLSHANPFRRSARSTSPCISTVLWWFCVLFFSLSRTRFSRFSLHFTYELLPQSRQARLLNRRATFHLLKLRSTEFPSPSHHPFRTAVASLNTPTFKRSLIPLPIVTRLEGAVEGVASILVLDLGISLHHLEVIVTLVCVDSPGCHASD